ncbi:MAG: SGNH/GDSL hydrolase family protein [Leptolyngbya sp. SIO1D8]|nr:SGNH/GDSL hydrolase family protein [Leptolyngbya sp. SIO1D8]
MKQFLASATGIALLVAIAPLKANAALFSQLYFFGDSLSDSGNLYQLTFNTIPQSPPYAQQFSNGPLWVDYLAEDLGLEPLLLTEFLANPFTADTSDGINFAFGGAGTGPENILAPDLPVGVLSQVSIFESFVSSSLLEPAEDALYIYLAGTNDLAGSDVTPPQLDISIPIANTEAALEVLIEVGAQNILVSNLPDFSITPRFNVLPQAITDAVSNQVSAYNQALSATIDELALSNPDVNFTEFDFNGLLLETVANPEEKDLTNVTDACLTDYTLPFDIDFGVCNSPENYLFWDDFHPTTYGYYLVTEAVSTELHEADMVVLLPESESVPEAESVPEPTVVWGMLALGFMAAGKKLHQRGVTPS